MLLFMTEKRTYSGLPDLMTKVAREELNRLSDDVTSCNVVYLPQVCCFSGESYISYYDS